jgi:glycosyltransferase involved in cell wall biosynthesis
MNAASRPTRLSIIMPAYNERLTIREIVSRVLAVDLSGLEKELIIVDDGSTDGTREIIRELAARRPEVRVILQPGNHGKGAAVARGLRQASGDIVIIQDADLEYDPSEYPLVLRPILEGEADVVFGSRFQGSPGGRRVIYFWHSLGNRLLTFAANAFSNLNLTDMETCYKAMTREVADRLDLTSLRFGIEPEITCKVARLGARIYEVPISYRGRTYGEGKKIGLKDALAAFWTILRFFRWEAPRGDVGAITLRRLASLSAYNAWLHKLFAPYLGRRILEVGSGVGNQTRFLLDREKVVASDIEPHYQMELRAKFGDRANVRIAAFRFPLSDPDRSEARAEGVDTVVCLNVLEHIEDDAAAVRDFASVLAPGGRLVLLVPAMPSLYGTLDVYLNHYRRYDPNRLRDIVAGAGFEIETLRYLNRPGVAGWWLNSRLLKRKILPRQQTRAFRLLLPLLRREERRPPSFGMSLLVLARKT